MQPDRTLVYLSDQKEIIMPSRRRLSFSALMVLCLLAGALCAVAPAGAAGPPAVPAAATSAPGDRQATFGAAAKEFGVPEPVLLAVSYNLSRWENHGGAPSFAGGYGPM